MDPKQIAVGLSQQNFQFFSEILDVDLITANQVK